MVKYSSEREALKPETIMPEVVLTGAAGRIEGRYSPRKKETAPIALILHPHPRAGGHMNNPVVGAALPCCS